MNRKWTKADKERWRDLIEHLDDDLPIDKPVHVRRRWPGSKTVSAIEYDGVRYLITVKWELPYAEAKDALIEEFAHALAGFIGGQRNEYRDHGILFGEAFATVTQSFLRWMEDRG